MTGSLAMVGGVKDDMPRDVITIRTTGETENKPFLLETSHEHLQTTVSVTDNNSATYQTIGSSPRGATGTLHPKGHRTTEHDMTVASPAENQAIWLRTAVRQGK